MKDEIFFNLKKRSYAGYCTLFFNSHIRTSNKDELRGAITELSRVRADAINTIPLKNRRAWYSATSLMIEALMDRREGNIFKK